MQIVALPGMDDRELKARSEQAVVAMTLSTAALIAFFAFAASQM